MGDITQRQMSEKLGIPYRTITSWDYRKNMPEWLEDLLEELAFVHQAENRIETEPDYSIPDDELPF